MRPINHFARRLRRLLFYPEPPPGTHFESFVRRMDPAHYWASVGAAAFNRQWIADRLFEKGLTEEGRHMMNGVAAAEEQLFLTEEVLHSEGAIGLDF